MARFLLLYLELKYGRHSKQSRNMVVVRAAGCPGRVTKWWFEKCEGEIDMVKKIVLLFLTLYFIVCQINAQEAIIIDHNCTDISQIPDYWINEAKANLRVGYGHTSHGSQLVTGIAAFRGNPGSLYYYTSSGWGLVPGIFLNDYWGNAGGADDLGHNGDLSWRDATIAMLGLPGNDRDVVMWSWCGGVSDNTAAGINTYLNAMNQLEQAYPGVTFIYMTGHLDGSGIAGNLHVRNEQIRAYCITNNKVLFDFADIESYDPDGNFFLNQGADDGCYYSGGNWADEWIAANPASELAQLASVCGSCAHSRRLNCILKGRAFWWMMARIAGWDGNTGPSISITSPGAGETFGIGKRIPIEWTTAGITGDVRIKLVCSDRSDKYIITYAVPHDSSPYHYLIPAEVSPGSYFIRVKQGTIYDRSADFSIGTIDINSPGTGQTYSLGGSICVDWTAYGITGDVKISLIRSGSPGSYVINPAVPYNSSPYDYEIPAEVTVGNYFVKIKQGSANGKSGIFTIDSTPPTITVVSPVGGAIYPIGSDIAVEWTSSGFSGDVMIKLIRSDRSASYVISPGTAYNNSPYGYTIPAEVIPGTYFVKVKKPGIVSGRSGNFSIVLPEYTMAGGDNGLNGQQLTGNHWVSSPRQTSAGAPFLFSILTEIPNQREGAGVLIKQQKMSDL